MVLAARLRIVLPLLLAPTLAGQGEPQVTKEGEVAPPPSELHQGEKRGVRLETTYEHLEAYLGYRTRERSVTVTWFHGPGRPASMSRENVSLPFWPTEVTSLGPNRFAVGGQDDRGRTVLLELGFRADFAPDPENPYVPLLPDRRELYHGDEAGKRGVRTLFANRGDACTSLFVQFHDSGDVYRLRADGSGKMERVASPSPDRGVPALAELRELPRDRWTAHHPSAGFVYACDVGTDEHSVPLFVVLQDRDRDGAIEPDGIAFVDANVFAEELCPQDEDWVCAW